MNETEKPEMDFEIHATSQLDTMNLSCHIILYPAKRKVIGNTGSSLSR